MRKRSFARVLAWIGLACIGLASAVAADEAKPVRVAVLLPFVEEALAEVPDRAQVVATVRRSLHEPARPGAADLGNPHSPNFEALAASRPDVVVGDSRMHARLRPTLERSGAEVVLLDTTSVDATLDGLVGLGERVGARDRLQVRADAVREQIADLRMSAPVPVLALFGAPGSFLVVTPRTWLGDLLGELNFENVGAAPSGKESFPGFVEVSDEQMVLFRPSLIVLVSHGDPKRIESAFRRRVEQGPWSGLAASAERGIHAVDPALFSSNPGFAITEAAQRLVALMAPELARGAASGDVP